MRVQSIEATELNLPLDEPFEIALGTRHRAANVVVSLTTDTGTVGYGEAAPIPPITGETQAATLATIETLGEMIIGEDLRAYGPLVRSLRTSTPGAVSAQFAIETAMLDAHCREREIALAELFGGVPRPVTTDITIPILPPSAARDRAEAAAADGFDRFKIKTGGDPADDVDRVAHVHGAVPDAELTVDANQGWTPNAAMTFAREIDDRGIPLSLIEQPVSRDDVRGLAAVRQGVAIPIAADESVFEPSDALRLIEANAVDYLNVKLGKSGILGAADIVAIARAAHVGLMIGCMLESAIGIHTAAHVVAGTEAFSHIDLDGNRLLARDVADTTAGPAIEIDGPGHGIVPDLE